MKNVKYTRGNKRVIVSVGGRHLTTEKKQVYANYSVLKFRHLWADLTLFFFHLLTSRIFFQLH